LFSRLYADKVLAKSHPLAQKSDMRQQGKMNRLFYAILYFVILNSVLLGLSCCAPGLRREAESPKEALKQVRFFYPTFRDDLDWASLELGIKRNLEYLYRLSPDTVFDYGPHEFSCQRVIDTQKAFLELIASQPDAATLGKEIRKKFFLYRASGRVGNRDVLFTGYFEPVFEARRTPDQEFRYPIYRKPHDLIEIDLSLFRDEFKGEKIIARIEGQNVLPYFSRSEIEGQKAIIGQGLEIAWLKDPLDVDFLQIQGSGLLQLEDGKSLRVGYATKNGRPYRSIGRYLIDKGFLQREEVSMQRIRRYLSEHPEMIDEVLNYDPSYVFFRVLGEGPIVGSINVPLTPGRSLALDLRLFPEGALAFISNEKPVVNEAGDITGWEDFSRFVLVQDTGGAIRGSGRADLFWGRGPYAELAAGHMKHDGELYILVKKP
jgi:membrane-bound lytic murein transglycosylase A